VDVGQEIVDEALLFLVFEGLLEEFDRAGVILLVDPDDGVAVMVLEAPGAGVSFFGRFWMMAR
jgi:hypothetical protein